MTRFKQYFQKKQLKPTQLDIMAQIQQEFKQKLDKKDENSRIEEEKNENDGFSTPKKSENKKIPLK